MKSACLVLAILVITASAQKTKKAPDVQVLEVKCNRSEEKLALDGKLKVTGEKPLKGLVLEFDFLSASGDVLTTQKMEVADDTMHRDDETPFHCETRNPPGSIRFKIKAYDAAERELRVGNEGPFTIE